MALPPTNPPGLVRDAEDLNKVVNGDGTTNRAGDALPSVKAVLERINDDFDAMQAGELTTQAVEAADRAETAAEVSASAGRVYESSGDGQSDGELADGDYFWVASSSDSFVLELWQKGASAPTDTGKRTINKVYVDQVTEQVFANVIEFGDFVGGDPEMRRGSNVIELTDQEELLQRGYKKAIQQRLGNEYVTHDAGVSLLNKYIFAFFIEYSENPANLYETSSVSGRDSSGGALGVAIVESGFVKISEKANLLWQVAEVTNPDITGFYLGTVFTPEDNTRLMTGFFGLVADSIPNYREILNHILISDKARFESVRQSQGLEPQLQSIRDDVVAAESDISELKDFAGSNAFTKRVSKNLFIESEMVDDSFLNNSGNINSAEGWGRTGYIPVVAGQQYTLSGQRGRPGVSFFESDTALAAIPDSYIGDGTMPLTVTAPAGASFMIANLYQASNPNYFQFQIEEGDTATEYEVGGTFIEINRDSIFPPIGSGGASTRKLILNGENQEASIEANVNGRLHKRNFAPFQSYALRSSAVFNFRADSIDGSVVRSGGDDVAPLHALGTTIAANHGFQMGGYNATGHGKTTADIGSVYEKDGVQYVLMGFDGSSIVYLANYSSNNATNTSGTFSYVSGGATTTDIVVSDLALTSQWHPPFQNRKIELFIDGIRVDDTEGEFSYKDKVVFVESYDVLERQDLLDWIIANGSSGEVYPVNAGQPAFTMTNSYEFDIDANCTIYQDWLFLKEIPFVDIMGVQCGRSNLVDYYIPKALPFTQGGTQFDYANLEPSNKTITESSGTVILTPERCEPDGILVDRIIGFNFDGNGFAMGFLPTQDTAISRRRELCTIDVWEIRGNTGKIYPRVVDLGNRTTAVGEYYSTVAYRNLVPSSTERTSAYPVRTRGADYFYCDWHDVVKFDRIEIPNDYAGREFEVVEARNATLYNGGLTGSIAVDVDCVGDYAYLIIKVAK